MNWLKKNRPLRRADIALCIALLLIAAALFSYYAAMPTPSMATVRAAGETAFTVSLPCPHTRYSVQSGGYTLIIEAEGRRVRVAHSDCPDQVCVRTGWIEGAGQAAVCVPAQVIVQMEGGRPEADALLR